MPNNEEHCRHTLSLYGVRGEDVHRWMDEPSQLYGSSHRWVRHDKYQEVPESFIEIYGEDLARNIMLDHILADSSEGRRPANWTSPEEKSKIRNLYRGNTITMIIVFLLVSYVFIWFLGIGWLSITTLVIVFIGIILPMIMRDNEEIRKYS